VRIEESTESGRLKISFIREEGLLHSHDEEKTAKVNTSSGSRRKNQTRKHKTNKKHTPV
jgi:hypothetical protein